MASGQIRRRNRKKRVKKSLLYKSVSFVIICTAMIFGMSVFFRVSNIEVIGQSQYSKAEIIEASGIEEGDNLFFINRFTAISKIFSKLPYIEEVTITRSLPNKLVFEVSESAVVAYITSDGAFWAVDRGCKVLDQITLEEASGLIRIDGITPENSPVVGVVIDPGDAESQKVLYLSQIFSEILDQNMQNDVTYIDMADITNPSFDYLQRFTVRLGKNEDIEYKFGLLLSAVDQLSEGDTGVIDLSIEKKAHFNPE